MISPKQASVSPLCQSCIPQSPTGTHREGGGAEGERERGREYSGNTSEEGAETMQEPKDGKENSGKCFWTCGGHCTSKLTTATGTCVQATRASEGKVEKGTGSEEDSSLRW